jgi:hypothetical protein
MHDEMIDTDNSLVRLRGPRVKRFGLAGIAIMMWRYWVTGAPVYGRADNATFWHDATADHRGRPYEKLTRARWRRVARRWALAGVPLALCAMACVAWLARQVGATATWAHAPWRAIVVTYVALAALGVTAWVAWRATVYVRTYTVRRQFIRPAAETLCRTLGVSVSRRQLMGLVALPAGYPDRCDPGTPVRVFMPANVALDDKARERIAAVVGVRLGLRNATGAWTLATARAYVDLLPQALPPATLELAQIQGAMLAAEPDRPILGVAQGGAPVALDYTNDSPHVLISAAAGAGKSTLLKVLAMQRLRHDAGAIFIDVKKWSHLKWVRGLPASSALYFTEIPEIHDALCAVLDELMRRRSIDDEEELETLRILDIYVEEQNTLLPMLGDYWRERRAQAVSDARASEDPDEIAAANGLGRLSPAIQALRYGVNMGREFRVHFHSIAQSMSANAAGGRDTRESYRTRLLARYDRKTWRMLADGTPYVLPPVGPVGLWTMVAGGEVETLRVPRVSDDQARSFVLSGNLSGRAGVLPVAIGGDVSAIPVRAARVAELATLAEIVPALPAGRGGKLPTVEIMRAASKRESSFPTPASRGDAGTAHLYRSADVIEWWERRERVAIDG